MKSTRISKNRVNFSCVTFCWRKFPRRELSVALISVETKEPAPQSFTDLVTTTSV